MSHVLWYAGQDLLAADVVTASNCTVVDRSGRAYVDLESGVWCTALGHCHPRVAAVLADQAGRFAHAGFNFGSAAVDAAALEVLSVAGLDDGRCVFLCSGSEAVEYMVRAGQSYLKDRLLLVLGDGYFGAYGAAARRSSDEFWTFDWLPCAGCRAPGCTSECARWREIPLSRIGGFLFEPGSSSGLVRFPPEKLVRAIASAVTASEGLLLVNEVTTGVGRTGAWFGHQHYGIEPDAVAMGKGIGNGYPVSVAAFGPVLGGWLSANPLRYSQSHQNDPLGACVAHEVLRVIAEEGLVDRGRRAGEHLIASLRELAARRGAIREVRGRGLMIAVELLDDPPFHRTTAVHRALAERGFLVGRRPTAPVLRLDPSLTVPFEALDSFVAALDDALAVSP